MEKRKIFLPDPFPTFMRELESKAVTNFYGEPGSGKTNICMLAMLDCIRFGGRVTYIDAEGGFSFKRLEQMMPNYKVILGKINLLEPEDFRDQGSMIRRLKEAELVVVDSLSALYRLEYAENDKNGRVGKKLPPQIIEANRELSKQLSLLSNFARKNNIPALVTNHTFRNRDTGIREVVGGDSVKYWSKSIVLLEKTGRSGERKAVMMKHRSLPEGLSVKFIITQEGIKPSGFRLF